MCGTWIQNAMQALQLICIRILLRIKQSNKFKQLMQEHSFMECDRFYVDNFEDVDLVYDCLTDAERSLNMRLR